MRGGFLHNEVLVKRLLRAFETQGWSCDTEVPVRLGETIGFIDLVAELDGYCIAVEAEMSAKRIDRDLQKASALHAAQLWIVTPNSQVARAVRRTMHRMDAHLGREDGRWSDVLVQSGRETGRGGAAVFVLTVGEAAQRVRTCLPLFAGS